LSAAARASLRSAWAGTKERALIELNKGTAQSRRTTPLTSGYDPKSRLYSVAKLGQVQGWVRPDTRSVFCRCDILSEGCGQFPIGATRYSCRKTRQDAVCSQWRPCNRTQLINIYLPCDIKFDTYDTKMRRPSLGRAILLGKFAFVADAVGNTATSS
jgi:hypothetical protein